MARIEAGIDAHQLQEALAEQARAHGEQEGERHFAGHQRMAHQVALASGGGAAQFQRVVQVDAGDAQRGADTEERCAVNRLAAQPKSSTAVSIWTSWTRGNFARTGDRQRRGTPPRQQHSGRAAGECQQQALGQRAGGPGASVPRPGRRAARVPCRVPAARESIRLATFAQAISSTSPTAPAAPRVRGSRGPPEYSCSGSMATAAVGG